ncbi:ABC transporter permease [Niabella beijingensis]|uniref:ABC transporter permease n=1 Tax=Niabella beijingensis TaxID=2872700 RepID=UPI001CC02E31|nr:ABC transporter permease [Niabella beijingensis]MBZ4191466.1 ABC transporter permease [Niabella beijingensis]
MFRNYLKTLLRTLQRNKMPAAINIIGMAVAFACCILLLLMGYNEFTYDNFHTNNRNLYKVYKFKNTAGGTEYSTSMSFPAAPALKKENMGVVRATNFFQGGEGVRYGDKTLQRSTNLVDNDFFSMFSFPVVRGAQQQQLAQLNSVVLTEGTAQSLFGKEDPIGKIIEVNIGGRWNNLQVSSVLKKIPDNSSITFDLLARAELNPEYAALKNKWDASFSNVFVQLAPGVSGQQAEKQLRSFTGKYVPVNRMLLKKQGLQEDANGDFYGLKLLPLKALHFSGKLGDGRTISKSFIYILLLVAGVILLIACFNFVNLNIGQSLKRGKEIGMRKCMGAGKKQIWFQFWGECFFILLIAFLLGGCLVFICSGPFNQLFGTFIDPRMVFDPMILAGLLLLLGAVSLVSSGYPSLLLTNLKATEVLKGKIAAERKSSFRSTLIVAQFVIAIVLICATMIIYLQFLHLREAPLGYDAGSLVSVPLHDNAKGKQTISKMRSLLNAQSGIVRISGSDINLGRGRDGLINKSSVSFDYGDKIVRTNLVFADYDIIKTLGLPLKAGRDLSGGYVADTAHSVIVTESVVKQFGLKDPIGHSFTIDSAGPKQQIIGVIPDFHLYSMFEKTEPLMIGMETATEPIGYLLVRINTQNPVQAMDLIKQAYAVAEPGLEFRGSFVDENIERWYQREKSLTEMFTLSAGIAILLSCMGLFGVSFIVISQRIKEIGIRKVLGASVPGVVLLIIRQFVKPVLIALIIAVPIAVWAMGQWLQGFEYRISMHWWVFVAAGVMALIIAVLTVGVQSVKTALANPVTALRSE